jgi:L-ascorbate metabolism protein UlaG (beta-lactamase superfamily)
MTPTRVARADQLSPDLALFVASPRTADGFQNPWGGARVNGFGDVLKWQLGKNRFQKEKRAQTPRLPTVDAGDAWSALPEGARLQWLGHAALRVQIEALQVVVDPTFGRVGPGPGMARLVPAPLPPEALGRVDVVALTHGHYDHLDARSLKALHRANPDAIFAVPLGLEGAMPPGANVLGFDWWQSVTVEGVEICFVPAQHWHRRGLADTNKALWGGWVIGGRVYHSGDTGYFGGFEAIGRVFPDLDAAVLPLGAYEPRWFMGPQHMPPEASVQAKQDLGARWLVGMHWGTFDLTDEPLDHGPFALLPEALDQRGVPREQAIVLAHGGTVDLSSGEVVGRV